MDNGTDTLFGMPVTFQAIILCAFLSLLCIATVVGNILVIVAVVLVPKLQRPENLLIISLAIADELVGLFVMPFTLLYEALNYWPFGAHICNAYLSLDITACSASILSLCAISLDRYFVISRPLQYGPRRTVRRMVLSVIFIWILSVIISVTPLFFFGNESSGYRCLISQDPTYQIYATVTAFYAPVAVMLVSYGKIYQAARKISKTDEAYESASLTFHPTNERSKRRLKSICREMMRSAMPAALKQKFQPVSPKAVNRTLSNTLHSRHSKAIRTLTAIVVAFLLSWSPFFVLALIRPFYNGAPDWVFAVTQWLGYLNSTVNPVLYSIFNKDFRRPFAVLLKCRCAQLRSIMRAESYETQFGYGNQQHSGRSETLNRCRNNGQNCANFDADDFL